MNKKFCAVGILAMLILFGTTLASNAENTVELQPGLKTEKMKDGKARRPIPPKINDSWAAKEMKKDGYDPKNMTGKDYREMFG